MPNVLFLQGCNESTVGLATCKWHFGAPCRTRAGWLARLQALLSHPWVGERPKEEKALMKGTHIEC